MARVSIFDWNGSLLDDVKADEKKFLISLSHVPGEDIMGFKTFEIGGDPEFVQDFLDHYELELDPV